MNAQTVYSVAKALPRKEFARLFGLLKKDIIGDESKPVVKTENITKKLPVLTDKEAILYLLDNVFNDKSNS